MFWPLEGHVSGSLVVNTKDVSGKCKANERGKKGSDLNLHVYVLVVVRARQIPTKPEL